MRPIRDAAGLFHDEPNDLASAVDSRGLRLIEAGRTGVPIGVLPYLEEEAIARLRHVVGPLSESEAEWKRGDWDLWRRMWSQEAHRFIGNSGQGPIDATPAYSAAEVVIHAAELRQAIEGGKAERAAALAMLVASWVFVGGVSVRLAVAGPAAKRDGAYRKKQRTKAQEPRTTVQVDSGRLRKCDLVGQALNAAANSAAGTADVWGHLFSTLEAHGMQPVESGAKDQRKMQAKDAEGKPIGFTFRGVQTMLAKLRADRTPPLKGRPKKKPAQPG
jgi:hypothetical protein